MKSGLAILAAVVLLGACASTHNATFVTKTSLSIVDVDTAPVSASIAFDRIEGYFGPRFDDGSVYPVTGYLHTTGSGITREIQQVFAGGRAAVLVLDQAQVDHASTATCDDNLSNPPLLLATGTTLGVKVGFAEGTPLPNSFTLGFRRKEATTVPVSKQCQPSVLASYDSDSKGRASADDPKLGTGIAQYFATGAAADALAANPAIKLQFKENAEAAFGKREAQQARLAVDTLGCASKVPDARFERVINNAEDLSLFADPGAGDRIRAAATPAERRHLYTVQIGLRLGDSDERTAALRFHKQRVCDISKQS